MEYSRDFMVVLRSLLHEILPALIATSKRDEVMDLMEKLKEIPPFPEHELWLCREVLVELLAQPEFLKPALEHLAQKNWSKPSGLLLRAFPNVAEKLQSCLRDSDVKALEALDPRVDQFRRRFLQSLTNYWLFHFPARPQPDNVLEVLLEQDATALSGCFQEFVKDSQEAALLTRFERVRSTLFHCGESGSQVWEKIEARFPQAEQRPPEEPNLVVAFRTFERFLRFSQNARMEMLKPAGGWDRLAQPSLVEDWIAFVSDGDPWY